MRKFLSNVEFKFWHQVQWGRIRRLHRSDKMKGKVDYSGIWPQKVKTHEMALSVLPCVLTI